MVVDFQETVTNCHSPYEGNRLIIAEMFAQALAIPQFFVLEESSSPLAYIRILVHLIYPPHAVTVANEGLGWDLLLKPIIVLVVTGILGGEANLYITGDCSTNF